MSNGDDGFDFFTTGKGPEFHFFAHNDDEDDKGPPFAFAQANGVQYIKTPFGMFTLMVSQGGNIAELGQIVAAMFKGGMTTKLLDTLSDLISKMPELKSTLEGVPQLMELLETAKIVIAMEETASGPARKSARPPSGMTFARLANAISLN
jgi:hypothetical protein